LEENFNNENQEMINKKKVLTNALSISIGIVFSVVVILLIVKYLQKSNLKD